MMTIHLVINNVILDSGIPRIVILINSIVKLLKINKGTRLGIIYKYADIAYILTNVIRTFIALTTASSIINEPFSIAQRNLIFGSKYQYVFLTSLSFQKDI